jgi:hypothetical protein
MPRHVVPFTFRPEEVMLSLEDYLTVAIHRPWAWGAVDCCFWAGDWIMAATGRDPLAPYRGTYDSALGAARLIKGRGGLVEMVGAEMQNLGFEPTVDCSDGDIAAIAYPAGDERHRAADVSVVIRRGPWWLARALNGCIGLEATPLQCWKIL